MSGPLSYGATDDDDDDVTERLLEQPAVNDDRLLTDIRDTWVQRLRRRLTLTPKWQCYKNLAFHSISCFMIFTSFMTFQSIDSTLVVRRGLGTISFAVLYGGFILSCFYAPAIVRSFGCKDTMLFSFIMQLMFALSHLYPRFYTLLPCSLLLGLMLGPFWTAQGLYIVSLSRHFTQVSTGQQSYEAIVGRFYGVFNFFFMSSQKFGNLMESLILNKHSSHNTSVIPLDSQLCGPKYCGMHANSTLLTPPSSAPKTFYVNLLVATYVGLCLLGIIVKAGLVSDIRSPDRNTRANPLESPQAQSSLSQGIGDMTQTVRVHSQKHMYLLVPVFFYSGLQQGFVYGDYTKAFVACELGIGHIGYVMLVYGYADAFSSLLVGWMERWTGRAVLFTMATVVQAGLVVTMELWTASWGVWVIYLIPGLWGVGDAVWQTTTSSMVGTTFEESREAAFACFRLWQAAGLATSFSYSHVLCTWVKLYIILAVMATALLSYYVLVRVRKRESRRQEGYLTIS